MEDAFGGGLRFEIIEGGHDGKEERGGRDGGGRKASEWDVKVSRSRRDACEIDGDMRHSQAHPVSFSHILAL